MGRTLFERSLGDRLSAWTQSNPRILSGGLGVPRDRTVYPHICRHSVALLASETWDSWLIALFVYVSKSTFEPNVFRCLFVCLRGAFFVESSIDPADYFFSSNGCVWANQNSHDTQLALNQSQHGQTGRHWSISEGPDGQASNGSKIAWWLIVRRRRGVVLVQSSRPFRLHPPPPAPSSYVYEKIIKVHLKDYIHHSVSKRNLCLSVWIKVTFTDRPDGNPLNH